MTSDAGLVEGAHHGLELGDGGTGLPQRRVGVVGREEPEPLL